MTSFDYSGLVATAAELIERFGRTVTIQGVDETPGDATRPWRGPDATPPQQAGVPMVFLPPGGSGLGRQLTVDDTLLETYDQVALLAADALDGTVAAENIAVVVDSGDRWRVERVQTLRPGGSSILHVLGLVT